MITIVYKCSFKPIKASVLNIVKTNNEILCGVKRFGPPQLSLALFHTSYLGVNSFRCLNLTKNKMLKTFRQFSK